MADLQYIKPNRLREKAERDRENARHAGLVILLASLVFFVVIGGGGTLYSDYMRNPIKQVRSQIAPLKEYLA